MTKSEYNEIVELHADGLFRFLLKSVKSKAKAEDLVQLSFERLWKKRKKVAFTKAKSYLFTIGYHAMIDAVRKQKREQTMEVVPKQSIQPKAGEYELKEWISKGLDTLNEQQRAVLLLRDYEGYHYSEIEEITGLSKSQVKVYIFRARKALKAFFLTHYKGEMKSYGYS